MPEFASAATYYVDSSITDTNVSSATPDCTNYNPATYTCSGGSASAYKTIADVNAGSFVGDDQILFRRGQTWRETLTVPSSGTSGHPITFGAFGSGDLPVLNAANVITAGSAWDAATQYETVASQTDKSFIFLNIRNVTNQTEQAAEWVASESFDVVRVRAWGRKQGAPTGNLFLKIYNESGGAPNTAIGQSDTVDVSTLTADSAGQEISFVYSTPVSLTSGNTYVFAVAGDYPISTTNYARMHGGTDLSTFPVRWRYTPWEEQGTYQLYIDVQKTATAPTIWETTLGSDPGVVLVNGAFYERVTDPNTITSNQWAYTGGKLYIYATADPDIDTVVEYAARTRGINIDGKSYVTVEDLRVEAAKSYGIQIQGVSSNIVLQDLELFASHSFNIVSQSGDYQDDVTVQRIDSSYAGGGGIIAGNKTRRWYIAHNTSDHDGSLDRSFDRGDYEIFWGGGIKVVDGAGGEVLDHVIEYNAVTNAGRSINGTYNNDKGIGIWLDLVRPVSSSDGSIVRYNTVSGGADAGLMCEKTWYSEWYGNLSYNNNEHGFWMSADEDGPVVRDNVIYNNTFYGNEIGIGVWGGYANTQKNVQDNTFKNNISVGNTLRQFSAKWGGENDGTYGSGNVYENNSFGVESANFIEWGAGSFRSTYDAWETSYGGTTNSIEADPLFTDAAGGEFTLHSGSPAIDAGENLGATYQLGLAPGSAWPSSVTTANQNSYGAGWEIGAYVYSTGTTTPGSGGGGACLNCAPSCATSYTASSTVPTGFGASWNQFTSTKELLLSATCSGSNLSVTAGNTDATTYVYRTGYRWVSSAWQPYTLSGSTPTGDWFKSNATTTIPKLSGTTYFVGYTCQRISGAWKCGCSDATCTTGKWQLQGIE